MNQDKHYYSDDECFRVQMDGTETCEQCPLYQTEGCGGKNILATGKNKKGYPVNEKGVSSNIEKTQETSKRKRKKRR